MSVCETSLGTSWGTSKKQAEIQGEWWWWREEGQWPKSQEQGLSVGGYGPMMGYLRSLPVLAVRRVGGRRGGWPAAHQERGAALRALGRGQWVLERTAGEGLRQVSTGRGGRLGQERLLALSSCLWFPIAPTTVQILHIKNVSLIITAAALVKLCWQVLLTAAKSTVFAASQEKHPLASLFFKCHLLLLGSGSSVSCALSTCEGLQLQCCGMRSMPVHLPRSVFRVKMLKGKFPVWEGVREEFCHITLQFLNWLKEWSYFRAAENQSHDCSREWKNVENKYVVLVFWEFGDFFCLFFVCLNNIQVFLCHWYDWTCKWSHSALL